MAASQQASSSHASSISQSNSGAMDLKLFRALRDGRVLEIRKLMRLNGNRFPGTIQQGNTALHVAARYGHTYVVNKILEHQHDLLYELNQNNETPMHIAARTGNFGVVKLLMTHRNTPNLDAILTMPDIEGNTPLHNAVRKCDQKMAFTMINKNPQAISCVNLADRSPLCIAIDSRLTYIACFMMEKNSSSLDFKGPNDLTLLHRAVIKCDYGQTI